MTGGRGSLAKTLVKGLIAAPLAFIDYRCICVLYKGGCIGDKSGVCVLNNVCVSFTARELPILSK